MDRSGEDRADAVSTARCGMAAEVLRSFGEVRLRVTGSSMLPVVLPGDIIDVARVEPGAVRCGDIVLFEHWGRLFAHRVVEAGERIVTRGDRHRKTDGPLEERELLGRVTKLTRKGRAISTKAGWTASITGPILRRSDRAARTAMRAAALVNRLAQVRQNRIPYSQPLTEPRPSGSGTCDEVPLAIGSPGESHDCG